MHDVTKNWFTYFSKSKRRALFNWFPFIIRLIALRQSKIEKKVNARSTSKARRYFPHGQLQVSLKYLHYYIELKKDSPKISSKIFVR